MFKRLILVSLIAIISLTPLSLAWADSSIPPIQRLGTGIPTSIAASPDGKTLAVGSSIGVWLLDPTSLQPIGFWDTGFWVESLTYSVDGKYLNAGYGTFDTSSGKATSIDPVQVMWQEHKCSFDKVLCAKETISYWPATSNVGVIASSKVIYSTVVTNTQTLVDAQVLHSPTLDVAWSPDNQEMYAVVTGTIERWDIPSWKVQQKLEGFFAGGMEQVIWSPDGRQIASGEGVWDVETAQIADVRSCSWSDEFDCINRFKNLKLSPHRWYTKASAMSADSTLKVTSGVDGARDCTQAYLSSCITVDTFVKIWDTQSSELLGSLSTMLYDPALSHDNKLVAGHSLTGIEVWDWKSGHKLWSINEGIGYQCSLNYGPDPWCFDRTFGVAFSPNGRYLATYASAQDKNIRLWDVSTGQLVAIFTGHTAPASIPLEIYQLPKWSRAWLDQVASITGVAFSPDGSQLAASSGDGTILIWPVP